jgi:flavin-dependent dehydrogenase
MNPLQPVEIIGGGLAGLSLGLALRHAGVPVSVTEAGDYPRHRVCGEFITGLGNDTVARLGLTSILHDARLHHEVAWFADGKPVGRQRLPTPARAVSRHRLDARLAQAFRAAGGELLTNTRITSASPQAGRIFATGRRRSASAWLGLKIHALGLPLQCDLELHLGDDAYVGLTGVEEGRVNICGLFHRRAIRATGPDLLLAYLREARLGALARRLCTVDFDPASFATVAAVGFDRAVPRGDRIALGDAGAMIPPFTGNGMAMALQSAEVALEPLLAYASGMRPWADARRDIQVALARRFRLRLAAAACVHPFLWQPLRQSWLTGLARARLLPLRPLYSLLH